MESDVAKKGGKEREIGNKIQFNTTTTFNHNQLSGGKQIEIISTQKKNTQGGKLCLTSSGISIKKNL